MKRQIWSIVFGIINHIFAWMAPLAYISFRYGSALQTSAGPVVLFVIIGAAIALRFLLYRLKVQAEDGFGLSKEFAKEFKFLIPLMLVFAAVIFIQLNIAGVIGLLKFTILMNIPAVAARLVSYRLSNRYLNDVAPKRAVELLQQQNRGQ